MQNPFGGVFEGRRVLVTGHTGFKGSWLTRWLLDLGAEVTGYALEPDTQPSLFNELDLSSSMDSHIGDVRESQHLGEVIVRTRPEIVFHLAAQPLVRRSYEFPVDTFEVNVMGTVNLVEACRFASSVRAIVNVTTDKVYSNPETGDPFSESEPLGGRDPYSASKAASEIVTASYRSSFFRGPDSAALATARAGNVIGGGDWAQDRLVPDCARALRRAEPIAVRNSTSVRPWQHVLEPLSGYLLLASMLWASGDDYATAYNFGPDPEGSRTVIDVVDRFIAAWGSGTWHCPDLGIQLHEAENLRLDISKATTELCWVPRWSFDETVTRTAEWYRDHADGISSVELVERDLQAFMANHEQTAYGGDGERLE